MRSKTSFFKISLSVVKEDFRKFWAIPVLAFIGYFLSGIFYILMNYEAIKSENGTPLADFIFNLLTGRYAPYSVLLISIPILSVLLIFRYMHNAGTVMSAHSQPFTRNTLLNSHALSALLFSILPVILTGIILLIIAQPVYFPPEYYMRSSEMVNVFTRLEVFKWIWESILISLFVISVALIGTMATGTSLHNALAALGFNFAVPGCILISMFYFDKYLFGYQTADNFVKNVLYTQPAIASYAADHFSISANIVYIVVIIALYAFAMFLYNVRKLERANDGVVFRSFDTGITLIFGYLGMTGLGAVFNSLFESDVIVVFGYIAGALLSMVICRMVVMKTIKIFTKESLKLIAAYAVFAVVFMAVIALDMTGYESRVPDNAETCKVTIYDTGIDMLENVDFDKEDMDIVKNLHSFIIENKELCEQQSLQSPYTAINEYDYSYGGAVSEDSFHVNFVYFSDKGNGDGSGSIICERDYIVPVWLMFAGSEYEAYINSGTVRNHAADAIPSEESIISAQVSYGTVTKGADTTVTLTDTAQAIDLRNAIVKDIKEMDGRDDIIADYNKYILAAVNLQFDLKIDSDASSSYLFDDIHAYDGEIRIAETGKTSAAQAANLAAFSYEITDGYRNTIAWLQENGYGDSLALNSERWTFAVVRDIEGGITGEKDAEYSSVPESKDGMRVITDYDQISELYDNARSHTLYGPLSELSTADDDIYQVSFYEPEDGEEYYRSYRAYIKGDRLPY